MHAHYAALKTQGKHTDSTNWDQAFKDQTAQNVNLVVNAIAKLLKKIGA